MCSLCIYSFNYFLCFVIIIIFLYQTVILQKKERYMNIYGHILYIYLYIYIYILT